MTIGARPLVVIAALGLTIACSPQAPTASLAVSATASSGVLAIRGSTNLPDGARLRYVVLTGPIEQEAALGVEGRGAVGLAP